jgi:hypothetical protein
MVKSIHRKRLMIDASELRAFQIAVENQVSAVPIVLPGQIYPS